jgi:hypothetical protein
MASTKWAVTADRPSRLRFDRTELAGRVADLGVDRLTFGGHIIEAGTDSSGLARSKAAVAAR